MEHTRAVARQNRGRPSDDCSLALRRRTEESLALLTTLRLAFDIVLSVGKPFAVRFIYQDAVPAILVFKDAKTIS